MSKHTYTIAINRLPGNKEPIEYKYRQTPCVLTCSRNAAAVSFTMGTARQHEDLISFRLDHAKDAMRKMYLLHAIRFSSRLTVRKILVTVDGETLVYDENDAGFPFLRSMLTAPDLALPASWQDTAFQQAVLKHTKSSAENDLRFSCLFSFLAGIGKPFEIERFTCYWTALNALYKHLVARAQPFSRAKLSDYDHDCLLALMRLQQCGTRFSTKADRSKYRSQYGDIISCLSQLSQEALADLHTQALAHRRDDTWFPEGALGAHLKRCTSRNHPGRSDQTVWGFLALDFAYYMRCNYLHGSKTTILFSADNDPEVVAFRMLNLFLGTFLREMIPQIFREDWITESDFRRAFPREK